MCLRQHVYPVTENDELHGQAEYFLKAVGCFFSFLSSPSILSQHPVSIKNPISMLIPLNARGRQRELKMLIIIIASVMTLELPY